jgi:hypothetical protein
MILLFGQSFLKCHPPAAVVKYWVGQDGARISGTSVGRTFPRHSVLQLASRVQLLAPWDLDVAFVEDEAVLGAPSKPTVPHSSLSRPITLSLHRTIAPLCQLQPWMVWAV